MNAELLELLERYEVVAGPMAKGGPPVVYTLCRRCPHVLLTVRDVDGNQDGLTLAELVKQASEHEADEHD